MRNTLIPGIADESTYITIPPNLAGGVTMINPLVTGDRRTVSNEPSNV